VGGNGVLVGGREVGKVAFSVGERGVSVSLTIVLVGTISVETVVGTGFLKFKPTYKPISTGITIPNPIHTNNFIDIDQYRFRREFYSIRGYHETCLQALVSDLITLLLLRLLLQTQICYRKTFPFHSQFFVF